MQNPIASIALSTGAVIRLELSPEIAPTAVPSFIHLATRPVFAPYSI